MTALSISGTFSRISASRKVAMVSLDCRDAVDARLTITVRVPSWRAGMNSVPSWGTSAAAAASEATALMATRTRQRRQRFRSGR